MKRKLVSLIAILAIGFVSFTPAGAAVYPQKPAQHLKKDGTPDKRFNANKHLKKDGTPDMRYSTSKKAVTKTTVKKKGK